MNVNNQNPNENIQNPEETGIKNALKGFIVDLGIYLLITVGAYIIWEALDIIKESWLGNKRILTWIWEWM